MEKEPLGGGHVPSPGRVPALADEQLAAAAGHGGEPLACARGVRGAARGVVLQRQPPQASRVVRIELQRPLPPRDGIGIAAEPRQRNSVPEIEGRQVDPLAGGELRRREAAAEGCLGAGELPGRLDVAPEIEQPDPAVDGERPAPWPSAARCPGERREHPRSARASAAMASPASGASAGTRWCR